MTENINCLVSIIWGNFPGGPVVKTLPSNVRGMGLNPGWGAKIPHALWPKNQVICNISNMTDSINALYFYIILYTFYILFMF